MKSFANNLKQSAVPAVLQREATLRGFLVAVTVVVMVIHLIYLTNTPPVFIDESWNANAAWNWLTTGNNFDDMHAGTLDQYGHEWLRWPKLGNLPWRISFALFGLGLYQLRIVSWLFGGLLLLAMVLLAQRSYSRTAGLLAALALAVSGPFLQASHYGRWDIMLPALALLAYWLALKGMDEGQWWCHLLAGLLVGVMIDIHQNAVLFMLGFFALYLVNYGKGLFRSQGTWLFAGGAALGIGYFLIAFILPDPEAYFGLFSLSLGNTHQVPITTLNPLTLLKSVDDEIGRYHFFENGLSFALIGAGAIFLAYRHNRFDRLLLAFVGAVFLGFVLLIGNKHDVYAILLYPFFLLMVGETLVSLVRDRTGSEAQRLFVVVIAFLFVVSSTIRFMRTVNESRDYSYEGVIAEIEPYVPAGGRVMGLPDWWLGMAEHDYRSSLNLTYYHELNGYSLAEGFAEIRPDLLILDQDLQALLVDEGSYLNNAGFQIYQLPRDEFEAILTERGELVHGFWNPWHGWIDLYLIQWGEQ